MRTRVIANLVRGMGSQAAGKGGSSGTVNRWQRIVVMRMGEAVSRSRLPAAEPAAALGQGQAGRAARMQSSHSLTATGGASTVRAQPAVGGDHSGQAAMLAC